MVQESISSTFYENVFHMKVLSAIHFGFIIFWLKDIGEKSARKMMMKLSRYDVIQLLTKKLFNANRLTF